MRIISIREQPSYAKRAIVYFQKHWATENSQMVYEDCIMHCLKSDSKLPQWYLYLDGENIMGCAGLITNDFISRMDLYPWLCALYIDPAYRGKNYGKDLIEKAKKDCSEFGYSSLYLCTDHIGYYEHFGFEYAGTGYHPWGESSRIYRAKII